MTGSLTNSATLATAKDIKINIDFFSKTGTRISNQEIILYEFIQPKKTIFFKEKIIIPDNYEYFEYKIISVKSE